MGRSTAWNLAGGVAVVTGAASGIGAALAEELAGRGMHLALADLDAAGLETVAVRARERGVQASTHRLDVADREAAAAFPQQVLQAHGRATVLVNNAGVALGGTFDQVAEADFDWLLSINFLGVVRLTRAFMPVLAAQPAAQVVNVSSIFGIVAPPGQAAYCASKFAVRGFSESLRHELEAAGSPVRVTVVHPGGVRTAIADSARIPASADPTVTAMHKEIARKMLVMPPAQAARTIADGVARRAPRVLVGRDARQAELLQRLLPVTYWKWLSRGIRHETGHTL